MDFDDLILNLQKIRKENIVTNQYVRVDDQEVAHSEMCDLLQGSNPVRFQMKMETFIKDPESHLHEECYKLMLPGEQHVGKRVGKYGATTTCSFTRFAEEAAGLRIKADITKADTDATFEESISVLEKFETYERNHLMFDDSFYKEQEYPATRAALAEKTVSIISYLIKTYPIEVGRYLNQKVNPEEGAPKGISADLYREIKAAGKEGELKKLLAEVNEHTLNDTRFIISAKEYLHNLDGMKRYSNGWDFQKDHHLKVMLELVIKKYDNKDAPYWQLPVVYAKALKAYFEDLDSFSIIVPTELTTLELVTMSSLATGKRSVRMQPAYETTLALR